MKSNPTSPGPGLRAVFGFLGFLGILAAPFGQDALAFLQRKAPEITSPVWINSEPLSLETLRGRVVLVEFWTFGCYNCRNVEPKIKAWHERFAGEGLVVLSVHSPEFSREKNIRAVRDYVKDHALAYPVIIDNDFANWNRFRNRYWPAVYLIDKRGVIRYRRIGEGGYIETEGVIQRLLAESRPERED